MRYFGLCDEMKGKMEEKKCQQKNEEETGEIKHI